MAERFKNAIITGGAFHFAEGDINFNSSIESTADRGIRRLLKHVAPGAFHDSGERFDPPKCHPNTRLTVIQTILDWLDDLESSELVMWLNGAAGAGKSAIAQTIAQLLCERGRLSGDFFFSRGSTTGRGDEKNLVATLAYQLTKYSPATRTHVAEAASRDPFLFDLSLRTQVQTLIIKPLQITSEAVSSSSNSPPQLLIIDGLDECHDPDVQCRIVQVFAAAMKSMQHHLPQKLLIASRSEIHLLTSFNEHNTATVCRRLPLDNHYLADNDIRQYLQDTFSMIKREHHMRAFLDNAWPSQEAISSLVMKSSGQFIYASTVVKYVASARHHPAERLKVILGLKIAGRNDRPFAALDSLYTYIFQNVKEIELVLCILRLMLAGSFVTMPYPVRKNDGNVCQALLGMTVEELEVALGDLISVISFDRKTGWFTFLHASIPDFLIDPHRSIAFHVDQPKVNLYRAECCVKVIRDIYSNRLCTVPYLTAWFHLSDCIGRLVDQADKELLYELLSSLDMRLALDHHFSDRGTLFFLNDSFIYMVRILLWSLQEHQAHPDKATLLVKLTHHFDMWLLSRLQSIPLNGFDNYLGIDLMVFFMTQIDADETLLNHRLNILGLVQNDTCINDLATALKIPCAELIFPRNAWFYSPTYPEYCLLLRFFFHDFKRSEKYFMNNARYANAALHCVNFLFSTRQTDTRMWNERRWRFERETVYLAMHYTTFFLGKAAAVKTLFELLLGTVTIPQDSSSVISAIEINARHRLNLRIDVTFAIGQRSFGEDYLGARGRGRIFDCIVIWGDKTIAEWREESVQMVVTAMSEYVSKTCQSFFPQNHS